MRALFYFIIRLYQYGVSPLLPYACRFTPTCSHYAQEAIDTHGPVNGAWLAAKRICRCHPLGGSGHDPVPHPFHKAREH